MIYTYVYNSGMSSFIYHLLLCILNYLSCNIWDCEYSAHPFFLMIIVRTRVLYLTIIIKSEVWPICHYLGLGHDTMLCTVCLAIFSLKGFKDHNQPLVVYERYWKVRCFAKVSSVINDFDHVFADHRRHYTRWLVRFHEIPRHFKSLRY